MSGDEGAVLSVSHLSVRFGETRALEDVSADFSAGVNGILGPNGAGKSTLFRVLTGGLWPGAGQVRWLGRPVVSRRDVSGLQCALGYLPQDPGWFAGSSATDLCVYMAGLRGVPRAARRQQAARAIEAVGLRAKAKDRLSALSGGQRRRAFIAQALVNDPPILVLDEPTSGLDPVQRVQLRSLVGELGRQRTVLLSTHLVEDVAHIARTVFVLDAGHMIWHGPTAAMAERGAARAEDDAASRYERGFLAVLRSQGEP